MFSHVTDSRKDRSISWYPEGGDTYGTEENIPVELKGPGVWYAELIGVDDGWRLRQRLVTPLVHMELRPQ